MPKAILEFQLPEEQEEYNLAINAIKYHCAIHDIRNYLRTLRKYDDRNKINKEELIDAIHALLENLPD